MKPFALAAAAVVLIAGASPPAMAANAGVTASLRKMDPTTRLVQACDLAIMDKTSSRKDGMTEHAVIDATSRAQVNGNAVQGNGGAFRRRGRWFAFSYKCQATADHMTITKLDLTIKHEIPRSQWEANGLYP